MNVSAGSRTVRRGTPVPPMRYHLILFYMNGCSHCVRVLEPDDKTSIWGKIQASVGKDVDTVKIEKDEIDTMLKKYKINDKLKGEIKATLSSQDTGGYPNLMFIKSGKLVRFNEQIEVEPVTKFVKEQIGLVKKTVVKGGKKSVKRVVKKNGKRRHTMRKK
jgi:glutaredoxin